MAHVAPGYDENSLLWDQEDGTLFPTTRPERGEGTTFRHHWGVDLYIGLPVGLRANVANRYIDALRPLTKALAEHAHMEHVMPDTGLSDYWKIVYTGDYKPYMMAMNQVIEHVFGSDIDDDGYALQRQAEKDLGVDYSAHGVRATDEQIHARMRQIMTEKIRTLIVDGDASYTPAALGARYTRIRVDLSTGHLTAHTTDDPDAGQNTHEWAVPDLNAQQTNRVMRTIGADALCISRPNDPAAIADDAWERIRQTLEGLAPTVEEVTAALDGAKDTPANRVRARRRLVTARVKSL